VAADPHHEARAVGTENFETHAYLLHLFLYDTLSRMIARSKFFKCRQTGSTLQSHGER
jgi:hypothetical protein